MMGGFGGYGYGMGGFNWLWMGVGMLLNFLLPLLVIGLIVFLLARKRSVLSQGTNQSDAVQILQERFAKGEITREEYQLMRQELER